MSVCNKCGRKFPKLAQQKVICLCNASGPEIIMNFPVIETKKLEQNEIILNKEQQGRKAWLMLHNYVYTNVKDCYDFYLKWKAEIPGFSHGCQCQSNWTKIEIENPPDFSSKEKFFEWGVKVHNLVNEKLGKPIISLEEAKKVYNMV